MGTDNSSSVKEIIINDEWFAEIENGEYVLNCRIGGMENGGETIILLHGFPETSYMWVKLMDLLVKKGYRVIAPDQRGYSPKARPSLIKEYSELLDNGANIDIYCTVISAVGQEKITEVRKKDA